MLLTITMEHCWIQSSSSHLTNGSSAGGYKSKVLQLLVNKDKELLRMQHSLLDGLKWLAMISSTSIYYDLHWLTSYG